MLKQLILLRSSRLTYNSTKQKNIILLKIINKNILSGLDEIIFSNYNTYLSDNYIPNGKQIITFNDIIPEYFELIINNYSKTYNSYVDFRKNNLCFVKYINQEGILEISKNKKSLIFSNKI
jgi:hypothetical protein